MNAMLELRSYVDSLPFIDTHSHMAGFDLGTPVDDRQGRSLPQILMNDYLLYLAGSCSDTPTASPRAGGDWKVEDAEEHFRTLLPLLEEYRGLSTYSTLREGIRELHPFDEEDITLANWRRINDSIVAAYRRHGERALQRLAVERAGVVKQTQMVVLSYVTDHYGSLPPEERAAQERFLLPSLILDGYLFSGFASGKPGRLRSMELTGMHPTTHAEYLRFLERCLDLFREHGGASIKLLMAYHRSLHFQEVGDEEAARLFARGPESLKKDELARLQDNFVWHLLEMAIPRRLPLLVHTGYSYPTTLGDPESMWNFFSSPRLRGLKVDLCHSGWPNHGQALLMARTFRHCYFNLCWTPLLSPTLGRYILGMAIDMVPRNKILIGTDCGSAEGFLGTARFLRAELARVLGEKMEEGQFGLQVAKGLAKAILCDNPREFYGLAE